MFKLIKDIIAPKKCYSCNIEWRFLCDKCAYKIDRFKSFCYVCKRKTDNFEIHNKCKKDIFFDKIIVFAHYSDMTIKKMIKKSKFYNTKDILEDIWDYLSDSLLLNEKTQSKLQRNIGGSGIENKEDYVIISVPMYFLRRFNRGYNHSDILAKIVSKNTWITYKKNIIKRVENTIQQSRLNKEDRVKNLHNCFNANEKYLDDLKNKTIIIVDDVISTWTTINEISKILKKSWIKKVIWLLVASD